MRRAALALALAATTTSLGFKLFNAIVEIGFCTGDDVEIHYMTFKALLGLDVDIWDLRNAFFPMAFIYPAQALAHALGVDDPKTLIVVGRLVVVGFSTAALALTFLAVHALTKSHTCAAMAVVALGLSSLHVHFSSTELPRPVAAAFLVGAFLLQTRAATPRRLLLQGALIAVAAALRFSEAMFVVPAVLALVDWARLRASPRTESLALLRHGALLGGSFAVVFVLIIGVSDRLYWGEWFHSLVHAIGYTLVDGSSSRGFQPPAHYLLTAPEWGNAFLLAGLLLAPFLGHGRTAIWALVPIAILTCLPHKEERYLVPIVPFIAIAAACSCHALFKAAVARPKWWRQAFALATVVALAGSVAWEAPRLRFWKVTSWVPGLEYVGRADASRSPVLFEGYATFGGGQLLLPDRRVMEIDHTVFVEELEAAVKESRPGWLVVLQQLGDDPAFEQQALALNFAKVREPAVTHRRVFRVFRRRQ